MRFKVSLAHEPRHVDSVSAVAWAGGEEMYSFADDHFLLRWNLTNMEAVIVAEMPSTFFPTSMHWFPRTCKREGSTDIFALSTSDGRIHFVNKNGKIEKSFEAHKGAVLQIRWSPDGTGLLSCGEDGAVKLWSRSGLLRSVIAQMPNPVYCIAFDSASNNILFSNSDQCFIKPMKTQMPPLKWKAHDGFVLCCDWSQISNHIVTGGEDCKFKLWDSFGRSIFISISHDFPISSVSWSADGEYFAVGSHNILRLCDKAGWSHSLEKLPTGSLLSICWFDDSTQLVAGCGNGQVIHAQIVERTVTSSSLEVIQTKKNMLEVHDLSADLAKEYLETRDRVIKVSIAHDQLIVVTTLQLYIYSSKNWNTPVIVDLKEKTISFILQTSKIFLISDGQTLFILNYDGRNLCEIKVPGNGVDLISERSTSLSSDTVATRDRGESTTVWLFDPISSKSQGDGKIVHEREIVELELCQCGSLSERFLAFRDIDAAVLVAKIKTYGVVQRIAKIGSSVEQLRFNDDTNILVGVGDGRIIVWPAVEIVFVDRSLLQRSITEKSISGLGKFPALKGFTGNLVTLRRSDGSLITSLISPFTSSLVNYIAQSKWDQAIRLCRHLKKDDMWAVLAGLATTAKNLYAAEIAYGALEEVEKVVMLAEARNHSNKEVREARMLLLAGKVSEADALLEKAGNVFQAIMLNIIMFRWSRAIDLAVKHNSYLEVVMGYRQRYLEKLGRKETEEKFIRHLGEVEIDFDHIHEIIAEADTAEEYRK
ncbi:WD domain, G-beta repeat protein [Dictyocaulus viviparus]|uniref:WD domain, G-beta repeat protein n=1 Tax=Dictyocaulus viviparus TaxID=29172 RepID=A0A0D8XY47_DICVI|nr:WD domain, G-beta repeat protein [Dictyocaulus viviparus]